VLGLSFLITCDGSAEVVFYCPRCAEREFGGD